MLTIASALIKCFKRDIQPNTQPNTLKTTAVKTAGKARSKKCLTTGSLTLVLGSGLNGLQLWTECFSSYDGVKVKRLSEPFQPIQHHWTKLERVLFDNRNNLSLSRFKGLLNRIAWYGFKGANKTFGHKLEIAFHGVLFLAEHYATEDTIEGLYLKIRESYKRIAWRYECDKWQEFYPFEDFNISEKQHPILKSIDSWYERQLDKLTSPAMVA